MRFLLTETLARALEQHIDSVCNERPIRDEAAYKIASRHRALPLFRGLDGYVALALTGEVLDFEWRHFDDPMPLLPRGRAYGAIVVGAVKHPELSSLLPTRQPDDAICEICGGSGHHPLAIEHQDERVVCECGGLGFIPIRFPDGEAAPPLPRGTAFPDITPSMFRRTRVYQIDSDQDIHDADELERLIRTMFAHPESECYYFRPKERVGNSLIEDAIARGLLADGDHEFFYYRREGAKDRNFVRIQRDESDDENAEILFGHNKRSVLWARAVSGGEMFVRTPLRLTDRMRRHLEVQSTTDRNPIEAKPGAFGFSIDLFKTWALFREWLKRRRG